MLPGGLSLGRVGGLKADWSDTSVHLWILLRKCERVVSRLCIFIISPVPPQSCSGSSPSDKLTETLTKCRLLPW